MAGCTTTTTSKNPSPTGNPMGDQTRGQAQPERAPARTSRSQTPSQVSEYNQADIDRMLERGKTGQQQLLRLFGQPHSITRSGREQYWNYTHQFRDEKRGVGGLKSLTIALNYRGVVIDYDFQDNTFKLD
jgi:outer membrane protein assembly factor BamE (lipoprotein component of BamABCDE complex)